MVMFFVFTYLIVGLQQRIEFCPLFFFSIPLFWRELRPTAETVFKAFHDFVSVYPFIRWLLRRTSFSDHNVTQADNSDLRPDSFWSLLGVTSDGSRKIQKRRKKTLKWLQVEVSGFQRLSDSKRVERYGILSAKIEKILVMIETQISVKQKFLRTTISVLCKTFFLIWKFEKGYPVHEEIQTPKNRQMTVNLTNAQLQSLRQTSSSWKIRKVRRWGSVTECRDMFSGRGYFTGLKGENVYLDSSDNNKN